MNAVVRPGLINASSRIALRASAQAVLPKPLHDEEQRLLAGQCQSFDLGLGDQHAVVGARCSSGMEPTLRARATLIPALSEQLDQRCDQGRLGDQQPGDPLDDVTLDPFDVGP